MSKYFYIVYAQDDEESAITLLTLNKKEALKWASEYDFCTFRYIEKNNAESEKGERLY